MNSLDVFSARDLRNHSGKLLKGAEEGRVSLITKHGRPAFVAVPFDERLLEVGLNRGMALTLFEQGQIGLSAGAKLAGISVEAFIELLGLVGVVAVDYPASELEAELTAAL